MNIDKKNEDRKGFNYKITEFFLNNSRLTILSFLLVVVLGVLSVFLLKTTGFPNPEIKFIIVNTSYPGASSELVEKQVTVPIENSIKGISGVESYNSNSSDSFSSVGVSILESSDVSKIKTEIESEISSLDFPSDVNKPKLFEPEIGGPAFLFLVKGANNQQTFESVENISTELNSISDTRQLNQLNDIEKSLEIVIDQEKIQSLGLDFETISSTVDTFGQSIPVASGEEINGENSSIVVNIKEETIDDLNEIEFVSQSGASAKLKEFATTNIVYDYQNESKLLTGISINDKKTILEGSVIEIKLRDGSDSAVYEQTLIETVNDIENLEYVDNLELDDFENKNFVYPLYSVTTSNNEQVSEVIGGLVGAPLEIDNKALAQVGWLLGGIQLVFLVMIAFVSWRAAVVAAVSIPLSLMFSTIYLLLTGNDLNTLVLFSLVLVIGLVVDPALVILESIQRKVDTGLRGKDAALAAVKDVGGGLFLATITNIIVFAPFGLISGVLGQIFGYIPLTIIPAVVGSYIVPLVFLAWIGGGFLRKQRGVKTGSSEEENLWGVAKMLKKLNLAILNGNGFVRLIIIVLFLGLSVGITGYYFGSRQVQSVQFSGTSDSDFIVIGGQFKSKTGEEDRDNLTKDVLSKILLDENVQNVYKLESGFSYYATLVDSSDRELLASEIVENLQADLVDEKAKFFDLSVDVESNGPPASDYQVSIAVNEQDQNLLKKGSLSVSESLEKVCLRDEEILVIENCGANNDDIKLIEKIDNGYEGQENNLIEVSLDRAKLQTNNLIVPGAPVGFSALQKTTDLFDYKNNQDSVINIDGEDINLKYSKKSTKDITTADINNIKLQSLTGQQIPIQEVGEILKTEPRSSIQRVNGEVVNVVQARLVADWNDEQTAATVIQKITDYYGENDFNRTTLLGLSKESIGSYSEGSSEGFAKSFQELVTTLLLAIFLTYFVLAIFFGSLTMPLVVLYTIPLTFIGIFPAISHLGLGEFGFLEIIGLIILIGIVENAAIFLVDSSRQYIREGMEEKEAIALASAIRMRPIILTTLTATASLAPLAIFSEFYRSLSLVIIFGLLTSGLISLITTPILFTFFSWLSKSYRSMSILNRVLFFPLLPFYLIYMIIRPNFRIVKVNNKVREVNLYYK